VLEPWHEFYGLLGTGAAALVALLFVAASIGATVFTRESPGPTRTYMSPVVFHYANILFLSLIALIPTQTWQSLGLTLGVAAIGSLVYSFVTALRVHRNAISDLPDRLAYGAVPVFCYAVGLVSAFLIFNRHPAGLDVLAGSALLLLVTNIRNAWDLMISLARRSAEKVNPPPSP
jgi:UDP-N-acetylmuramyl pentapeptide phosphotransferase/UDP-N-acetylglucosamine-1-phosphate transferase